MRKFVPVILLAVIASMFALNAANAQATRTWVSGVGDDANPCSRTAPCKTFAGAISKTAAHGEISVLDPGGFGALTITKSISIVSEGSEGSILACSTNGININVTATDVVSLHGIFFEGCNNGLVGIRVLTAGSVHIRKCLIRGFTTATSNAISITPSSGVANVTVSDCAITKNKQGILAAPTGTGSVVVVVERTVLESNNGPAIRANTNGTVRLSNSVVTSNNRSFLASGGGQIISSGSNLIANNTTNDPPTSTVPLQ
jgi:hypothetical protein